MKRITIKDLAQQLGVNPSTISRALKDHPDISPALREQVKQLADTLHYRPNHTAVNLRRRSSRLVGLIIPETIMFFYPYLIKGIEHVLHRHGYSLIMLLSNDSLEREAENIQICFDNDVAGLMIAFSRETKNIHHLELMEEAGTPIVMFDKVLEEAAYASVVLDDFSDAMMAVRHLVDTGCRRIAGIFGNLNMRITQLRLNGFTAALKQYGLPVSPDSIFFADDPAQALECARLAMQAPQPPDGIFAMTDEIIVGALPGLLDSGIKIPDACSIICMSDGILPYFLRPQVTFLRHDGYEVGRMSAEQLCALIQNGEHLKPGYPGKQTVLQTELVELATTRKRTDAIGS